MSRCIAPKTARSHIFNIMVIVCRRCFRRSQIPMPPIGARLRCTSCQTVQVFGVATRLSLSGNPVAAPPSVNFSRNSVNSSRPRQRRSIAGITRFSDHRAPAANRAHVLGFDDDIDDLWAAG